MSSQTFSEEVLKQAVSCYMKHVNEFRHSDPLLKDLFQAIVSPETKGEFCENDELPTKTQIADRFGSDLGTISSKSDFWTGEDFVSVESPWEALELLGLIEINSNPWSHRIQRNDVLCSLFRDTYLSLGGFPNPDDAETEQEKDELKQKRRMMACFGLSLLSKCQPDILNEYSTDSFPTAYSDSTPLEILSGMTAEQELSSYIEDIEVTTQIEEDENRVDRNDKFWQYYIEIELEFSEASPLRNPGQLDRYFQEENSRLLQGIRYEAVPYCQCESVGDHIFQAMMDLSIGGDPDRLLDGIETDDEATADDENDDNQDDPRCPLAKDTIEIDSSWADGEVTLKATWEGWKST